MKKDTSWEDAAGWYDSYLKSGATYQSEVIWPNVRRLLQVKARQKIADIGCGSGFFSGLLSGEGAEVFGVDASASLITAARKNVPGGSFIVADATKTSAKANSFDAAILINSLENMENPAAVLKETARILKDSGRMLLVINHPAFRIPGASSWGFDKKSGVQYRRLDSYLSERKVKFLLHPSKKNSPYTINYHRPLQSYFKMLKNAGFVAATIEEWVSHKKSRPGSRALAENVARKEFPLFLALLAIKAK